MSYDAYLPSHVHILSCTLLLGIIFQTPFTLSLEEALTSMLDESFYYIKCVNDFYSNF